MTLVRSGFLWEVAHDGYCWLMARPANQPRSEVQPFLIESRLVNATPARYRRYEPLQSATGLFRTFADAWRSRAGIVKFVNEYGLLGEGVSVRGDPKDPSVQGTVAGESFSAWCSEITAMRRAVDLWDLYRKGNADRLAQYIIWEKDSKGGQKVLFRGGPVEDERGQYHPDEEGYDPDGDEELYSEQWELTHEIAAPHTNAEWLPLFKPGDVFRPALAFVQQQINERLKSFSPPAMLYDLEQDRLLLQQVPRNLRQAMWLQFAEAVSGDKKHHMCRGCFRWFEISSRGMRSTRFHCSNACRIRAHRRPELARQYRAEGRTFSEIAQEFRVDIATVKQWIAGQET